MNDVVVEELSISLCVLKVHVASYVLSTILRSQTAMLATVLFSTSKWTRPFTPPIRVRTEIDRILQYIIDYVNSTQYCSTRTRDWRKRLFSINWTLNNNNFKQRQNDTSLPRVSSTGHQQSHHRRIAPPASRGINQEQAQGRQVKSSLYAVNKD